MARFYTSDLHFSHANIIKFCDRPYFTDGEPDPHWMNTAIVDIINSTMTPDDDLWVLGDMFMGRTEMSIKIRERFNVRDVFLVPGNHDKPHPMHKKAEHWRRVFEDYGVTVVDHDMPLVIEREVVRVCHFPPSGDSRTEDRFTDWRPTIEDDEWLLCGHVHDSWRQRGRVVNVGLDAWGGCLLSDAEILDIIGAGPVDRDSLSWL